MGTMGSIGPVLTVLTAGLMVRMLHYLLPQYFTTTYDDDDLQRGSKEEPTVPDSGGEALERDVPVKAIALAGKDDAVDETGDRGVIDAKSPSEIQILEHHVVRVPA